MTILPILFWIILVLAVVFNFIPRTRWESAPMAGGLATVALFVIIGLRIFRIPL